MKTDTLNEDMGPLASSLLNQDRFNTDAHFKYRAYSLLGNNAKALNTVNNMVESGELSRELLLHYELYLKAKLSAHERSISFDRAFGDVFQDEFSKLSNEEAYLAGYYATYRIDQGALRLGGLLQKLQGKSKISPNAASELIRQYQDYFVYGSMLSLSAELLSADADRRYIVKDDVLIETEDGAILSATVVRPRDAKELAIRIMGAEK